MEKKQFSKAQLQIDNIWVDSYERHPGIIQIECRREEEFVCLDLSLDEEETWHAKVCGASSENQKELMKAILEEFTKYVLENAKLDF